MSSDYRSKVAHWLHCLQEGDDQMRIHVIRKMTQSRIPIRALFPLLETALRESPPTVQTIATMFGFRMGGRLSAEDVHALEGVVHSESESRELNLMARVLLIGCRHSLDGFGRSRLTKECSAHAHYIIANAPDFEAAGTIAGICFRSAESNEYQIAKELWKNHLARHRENTCFLKNAAEFFKFLDPQLRDDCLIKGQSLEPWNPYWRNALANDEKDDDTQSWSNLN